MITRYGFDDNVLMDGPEDDDPLGIKALLAGGGGAGATTAPANPNQARIDELKKASATNIAKMYHAGVVYFDELVALYGLVDAQAIAQNPPSTKDAVADVVRLKANPPALPAYVAPGAAPTTVPLQAYPASELATGVSGSASASPQGGVVTPWADLATGVTATGSASPTPPMVASAPGQVTPATTGTGGTASAPAAPKPPARNSIADLVARGALNVSGTPVLEGQQYRRINEVVQAPDGQWYVVNPQGQPMSGPFPNQTQANAANVYTELGPAVTSNQYANIGNMALAGANRPRISTGTGQDAVTSLDQIIQATKAKGMQLSDFLGAANIPGAGLADVGYGKIPDYGGMRGVLDAAGNVQSFTGRMLAPDGREIAVGRGAVVDQGSTGVGSQIWNTLAPYLSQSQIDRIDPADYAQISLAVNALRDQGLLNQADTAATKQYQSANYKALTGQDPYDLDILPETYARGGSMTIREPSVIQGLLSGKPYGVMGAGAGERVSNITPLGNERQQRMAGQHEAAIAQALGAGQTMPNGGTIGILPGETPQDGFALWGVKPSATNLMDKQAQGIPYDEGNPRYTYYDTGNNPMARLNALAMYPGDVEVVRRQIPEAWGRGGGTSVGTGGSGGGRDFIDRNENGIDDREEEWTRPDGSKYKRRRKWTPTPQTPPTPNVFGMGGQVTTSPAMNPMHDPMVLEMMARGVRKRAKKLLPAGYI